MVDSSQIPYAIAIDFDGILCQNAYPDIGDPNWDTINQALKEQTGRGGHWKGPSPLAQAGA